MRTLIRFCAALALVAAIGVRPATGAGANGGATPFVVTASTGPAAGSRIAATVTRAVGGSNVTLPAALVPALKPGDVVDVDFPDYRRPPTSVNYHVNVAFITETPPQRWLFEHSGPADRLFRNGRAGRHGAVTPAGTIHFTYGSAYYRGIPIFAIIPEDAKTRGVDGVRDYVNAHPTDFIDMSQSTNDAVDKYSFLRDFLAALANGSIDPTSARDRVESAAQSLGVAPATIDPCYASGGTPAGVRTCIQHAVNGVVYQTNFNAPTQAQFFGGILGAANPVGYASYIGSLLTVWRIFVHTGHQEYEYVPATISLADPSAGRREELLMGLKVPTVRPPAATSDVLFFTIGDPQAVEHAPVVVNEASPAGTCERTEHVSIPLHFDHTSRYVHDAALVVTPDGAPPYRIALDPHSLDAPLVDRARFAGSTDGGYTVSLSGRFGFAPVREPARVAMRMAFPSTAPWTIAAAPHHPPLAGGALDVVATAAGAACLSHAELQIGSAAPIPLRATQLDDRRVELTAPLANVPAGPAQIRLYQDDPRDRRAIESAYPLAIQAPPAQVDAASAVASLGDPFISLHGTRFERIRALLVGGATYAKEPSATDTSACFDGPPLAAGAVGQHVTAQLVTGDGGTGEVFPLTLAAARPTLAQASLSVPPGIHLSTSTLALTVNSGSQPLPRTVAVRVRQVRAAGATPCDALRPDPTAVTLPETRVHLRSASTLAVDFRADALHDAAFGALQIQLVDTATKTGSDWVTLPGTFARAPDVAQIACPAAAETPCRLYGTELSSIGAVQDTSGTFVAPNVDCPPTEKGVTCIYVPHVAHYTLRLVDAGTIETLPDSVVARGSP